MKCSRFVGLVLLAGCGSPTPLTQPGAEPAPTADLGSQFDSKTAGSVRGQVTWSGPVPTSVPLNAVLPTPSGYRPAKVTNPFLPVVDPKSHGVAHALISLQGIDPAAGKPWDRPPVRVELRNFQIELKQGTVAAGLLAFVRAGDEVGFESADTAHHMLRARGAAFFTLPFPAPRQSLTRRLPTPGIVELTSGAGYYWSAADLVVCEHPYFVATDRDGRFTLEGVPPGKYELVCRVRNWQVVRTERDPETGLLFRVGYGDPVEKRSTVRVTAGATAESTFDFAMHDFPSGR